MRGGAHSAAMLYMIASLAALGGFLFGYDLGLIAGALLYMEPDLRLSEASEEVIVGMAKLGAVFGTFVGGAVMQEHGRRKAIAWNAAFFLLGPFIMAVGNNAAEVSLGRFIVGMGVGASAVAVPAYVGEMAPKAKRGSVVTVYELMVCFGMITSGLVDWGLRGVEHSWRWMVAAPMFPALAMAFGASALPESPRWLVIQGRLREALDVIHSLREGRGVEREGEDASTAAVEAELMELWSAVEKERAESGEASGDSPEAAADGPDGTERGETGGTSHGRVKPERVNGKKRGMYAVVRQMLTEMKGLRKGPESRAFAVALWLAFFNQATCSTSVINFAPQVLEKVGVHSDSDAVLLACAVSLCKLVGVATSMFLVDRIGRRVLLIVGSHCAAVAMACLAIAYDAGDAVGSLLFMCLFMLAFSTSWAGVFWVILSELFSMGAKSAAMSAAAALLFATGAFTDFVFLSAARAMGGWAFGIVACVCVWAGVYVQWNVPETKGKSLAEVQAMMAGFETSGGGLSMRSALRRLRRGPSSSGERYVEMS